MNKTRKVELLYKKAKGMKLEATPEELGYLVRYKVRDDEGSFYTTKSNIKQYVDAVDKDGCRLPFYDWCMNNNKADKRRKGSSVEEMEQSNKEGNFSAIFIGWLTWGAAIYWAFQETLGVGACAIIGAVISVVLFKNDRRKSVAKLIVIPFLIAYFFSGAYK